MPALFRRSWFWLIAFVAWFATLWMLSSQPGGSHPAPDIPHFDKIAHFGFFFGGGGLLSAFLFFLQPTAPSWKSIILTVVLVLALVGALDEWRQSFTPGRSGNDVFDWLADVLGALCGALVFKWVHPRLKPHS